MIDGTCDTSCSVCDGPTAWNCTACAPAVAATDTAPARLQHTFYKHAIPNVTSGTCATNIAWDRSKVVGTAHPNYIQGHPTPKSIASEQAGYAEQACVARNKRLTYKVRSAMSNTDVEINQLFLTHLSCRKAATESHENMLVGNTGQYYHYATFDCEMAKNFTCSEDVGTSTAAEDAMVTASMTAIVQARANEQIRQGLPVTAADNSYLVAAQLAGQRNDTDTDDDGLDFSKSATEIAGPLMQGVSFKKNPLTALELYVAAQTRYFLGDTLTLTLKCQRQNSVKTSWKECKDCHSSETSAGKSTSPTKEYVKYMCADGIACTGGQCIDAHEDRKRFNRQQGEDPLINGEQQARRRRANPKYGQCNQIRQNGDDAETRRLAVPADKCTTNSDGSTNGRNGDATGTFKTVSSGWPQFEMRSTHAGFCSGEDPGEGATNSSMFIWRGESVPGPGNYRPTQAVNMPASICYSHMLQY